MKPELKKLWNLIPETKIFLEDNIGSMLFDIGLSIIFWGIYLSSKGNKSKNE